MLWEMNCFCYTEIALLNRLFPEESCSHLIVLYGGCAIISLLPPWALISVRKKYV